MCWELEHNDLFAHFFTKIHLVMIYFIYLYALSLKNFPCHKYKEEWWAVLFRSYSEYSHVMESKSNLRWGDEISISGFLKKIKSFPVQPETSLPVFLGLRFLCLQTDFSRLLIIKFPEPFKNLWFPSWKFSVIGCIFSRPYSHAYISTLLESDYFTIKTH